MMKVIPNLTLVILVPLKLFLFGIRMTAEADPVFLVHLTVLT